MGKCSKLLKKYGEWNYLAFRLLVGLMFFMHGFGKLWGAKAAPLMSLMGFTGVVEVVVGLAVLFGLWTRLAALGGAITMLVAYFKVHAAGGLSPLVNGGELAVMYFVAFLVLMQYGAGKLSLEKKLKGKECF